VKTKKKKESQFNSGRGRAVGMSCMSAFILCIMYAVPGLVDAAYSSLRKKLVGNNRQGEKDAGERDDRTRIRRHNSILVQNKKFYS